MCSSITILTSTSLKRKKELQFFLMQYLETSNMEAYHKRLLWKLFSWKFFVKAYKLVMVQFRTPLHVMIHTLVIIVTFSKLQKVLEQIEIDESLG
jgi:hypothetical protein